MIGQGGSGGALAISVGDRILMLENAIYAVAPPEACAAILWKDAGKAAEAAATMRITARDMVNKPMPPFSIRRPNNSFKCRRSLSDLCRRT